MSIIISNASPLISLCSINGIQILKLLWKEIVIPKAVYREVVEEGAGKTGADIIAMACKDWIKVVAVQNMQEVEALKAVLDDGEAEVIAIEIFLACYEITFFASGGQGLFLKKPPLDPAKTFV